MKRQPWTFWIGLAILAALTLLALTAVEARAQQTVLGNRIAIGSPPTAPTGTSANIQGLGSSGGTLFLVADAEADIMARLLAESDIPAAFTRRHINEAISGSWTFTALQTFGAGMRASAGNFTIRNPTHTSDILTLTPAGLLSVPSASITGVLGVGGLSTLSGGFVSGADSAVNASLDVSGLTTLAKARTTGIRGVSSPFTIEASGGSTPTIAAFHDAGRVVLSTTGTTQAIEYAATGAPTGQRQWRTGGIAGSYLVQAGTDALAWTTGLQITAAAGVPNGIYVGSSVIELAPLQAYRTMLGTDATPYLSVSAAELNVGTLVARERITSIGGSLWITRSPTLTAAITAGATSIQVSHNNLLSGDRLLLQDIGKVEFMAVTSGPSGAGPYTYTVTRNLDGTGADAWNAGDTVVSTGGVGDGWWEWYADRGVRAGTEIGPTGCANVRTGLGHADWRAALCLGNLRGKYGYGAANIFGLATGDPAGVWFSAEATNGIRYFANGTDQTAHYRLDGSILLGREGAGQENVYITPTAVNVRLGTDVYIGADSSYGARVGRSGTPHLLASLDGTLRARDASGNDRIRLAATGGLLTFHDPSGATKVSIDANGQTWGDASGLLANVHVDTSGTVSLRNGVTPRIQLDAGGGYIRYFNIAGEQIGYMGGGGGSAEIVLGRGNAYPNQPYFYVTNAGAGFCVSSVTCSLQMDGTTGNFTSYGSISLAGGGQISSAGNFVLGNAQGLRLERWSSTSATSNQPRSVSWYTGGTLSAVVGQDANGALRLESRTSGSFTGVRMSLGAFAFGSTEPGLFITYEPSGTTSLTNIVAQAAASSIAVTEAVIQFVPIMAGPGGMTRTARIGLLTNPWHEIHGQTYYSSGQAGFTGSTYERLDNGTLRCQYNWSGGILLSTNCF